MTLRKPIPLAVVLTLSLLLSVQPSSKEAEASVACPGWTITPAPSPPPPQATSLRAVETVSANDVWAVGSTVGIGLPSHPVIEHWNGTEWTFVPGPAVQGGLNSVSAVAQDDVWAVGFQVLPSYMPLVEHWNGAGWSLVQTPTLPDATFSDVEAIAADDVWAVGQQQGSSLPLAEHWTGAQWDVIPVPSPSGQVAWLTSISAVSATDIWAGGSFAHDLMGSQLRNLSEHWDGIEWKPIPIRTIGVDHNYLTDVEAISSTGVWAVGGFAARPFTQHWDGTAWRAVPSPEYPPYSILFAVVASSPADVWAVGQLVGPRGRLSPISEHWDGSAWSSVPTPTPHGFESSLEAVDVDGSQGLWAVGQTDNHSDHRVLVERYCP